MHSSADYAAALLGKARDDAYVVCSMCADPAAPEWIIGFHAQQAAEKAIKAALTRHRVEFPRTHNLTMLVELPRLNDLGLPPDAEDLARLTPFGAALCYDDTAGEDDPAIQRDWAMDVVIRTLSWAETQ